jgi:uncharacterized LabA/DUF88 family protein
MKVAILVDGGYFLKRLPTVRKDVDAANAEQVDKAIGQLVWNHLVSLKEQYGGETPLANLYRCFFYDAKPYLNKGHRPVTKRAIDYSKTPQALFRNELFALLRKRSNFAVRLGETRLERAWVLSETAQRQLLLGERAAGDLSDDDFHPGIRQKAVDMRLGIDFASLSLKRQVDTIVLVAGDSDFVPAAKLARREGVRVILDPLWQSVAPELFEHIDGLKSGYARPKRKPENDEHKT